MINVQKVRTFCKDEISKIENYEKAIADTTQVWHCHHRLELTLDGEFAHTRDDLKRLGMYYHRPYFELIFLTSIEHRRLHTTGDVHPFKGKHHSEESIQKMSDSHKGKTLTVEHCKKLSESLKGHTVSAETRKKISAAKKGTCTGKNNPRYGKRHSEETIKKMREAALRRAASRRHDAN